MLYSNAWLIKKILSFRNYEFSAMGFLHVRTLNSEGYKTTEKIYKDIFKTYGINSLTLEFCSHISMAVLQNYLNEQTKNHS